uniref:Uncharacterized protein n=1 Tax=Ciona intestinalis TaxID=7719 RepID=H2XPG1_CIOIN
MREAKEKKERREPTNLSDLKEATVVLVSFIPSSTAICTHGDHASTAGTGGEM